MTITELSIKRPSLVIVVFIFLSVLGLYSYSSLNYELLPEITPPMITISTIYSGASPNEVESSVTKKLEDAVTAVENIKKVTASSFESISFVLVEFKQNADADQALQDVQRKVNETLIELPKDVEKPLVTKFSLTDMPILVLAATSNMEDREFYQFMKDNIKPRISRINGVGMLTLVGGEEREIKVNVNSDQLVKYNLSILQILETIKKGNMDFPVGAIKDESGQFNVRVTGKLDQIEKIRELVIFDSPETGKIKVRDIADVTDGTKEIISISRLNKHTALGVMIQRQSGANTVEVCELVKAELQKIEQEYSSNELKFEIGQDESVFTLESAEAVNNDLMFAIFLVGITMLIFLHSFRNSIIVMIAIPASLVSTFISMYIFDFSLNMMSLLALSLVIGILVDDSIVVLENIYRHLEMGKDKRNAALVGRNEIGFTALSITLVDVVVFLPLALLSGLIGNLMRQFAGVIVVSTLLSLFVSFTITPMLASRFSKLEIMAQNSFMGKISFMLDEFFRKLGDWYSIILTWTLNHRKTVIVVATILLFSSFALIPFGFIGGEFVTPSDKGEISVVMELEPGAKLERTNRVARHMEDILLARPEVTRVFSNIGASDEGFLGQTSNNITELRVGLIPKEEREESILQLCKIYKDIARTIPGVEARVAPITMFGSTDMAPVAVGISGPEIEEVNETADIILEIVKNTPGTSDVRKSTQTGKPELQIDIDRERMAALGLTLDYVGAELRVAINGDNSTKMRKGHDEYDIRVAYDEYDKNNPDNLENFTFINNSGKHVYLKQFARVLFTTGPSKLERKYRNSSVTVLSMVAGRPSGDIGEDIKKEIDKLNLPAGIKITYENDLEMQEDSFGSLGYAFLAAILFVYLILVALYNSFVYPFTILLTIPLAVIGALYALALTMNSLNIMSILGMIMLVGLVGKNAILLVDRINQNREGGMKITDSIMESARTRLRPILMTTLTMVFGVLPIAFSSGASNEMKHGLAFVLIGGLTSSLFLTLLLVPVMYVIINKLQERAISLRNRFIPTENVSGKQVMKNITLLLLLGLFLANNVVAQERHISMNDAVKLALKNNTQIKMADYETQVAENKLSEISGNLFPEISAEGTYIRNTKLPVFFLPSDFFGIPGGGITPVEIGEKNMYEGYLKFQVPLFNYGLYKNIGAADNEVAINKSKEKLVKNDIITKVKLTYLTILILKEQQVLVLESIDRARERLYESQNLLNQGMVSEVDTLTAHLGVKTLLPLKVKSESDIKNVVNELKQLLGIPHDESVALSDSMASIKTQIAEENDRYLFALKNRPEMNIYTHQLKANENLREAAVAEYLPSLSAFGQLKIEAQEKNFNFDSYCFPTSSMVGIQLNVPLFSGFRTRSKVESAEIGIKMTQLEKSDFENSLRNEISSAEDELNVARLNKETQKSNLELAQRNYSLMLSRFKNGFSSLSELRDSEMLLREAENLFLTESYNYIIAGFRMDRTLGSVLVKQ